MSSSGSLVRLDIYCLISPRLLGVWCCALPLMGLPTRCPTGRSCRTPLLLERKAAGPSHLPANLPHSSRTEITRGQDQASRGRCVYIGERRGEANRERDADCSRARIRTRTRNAPPRRARRPRHPTRPTYLTSLSGLAPTRTSIVEIQGNSLRAGRAYCTIRLGALPYTTIQPPAILDHHPFPSSVSSHNHTRHSRHRHLPAHRTRRRPQGAVRGYIEYRGARLERAGWEASVGVHHRYW